MEETIARLVHALTPFAEAYQDNPVNSDPEFKAAFKALEGV